MRLLAVVLSVCIPLIAFGYTSVIAKPTNQNTVLQIADIGSSQEFFGKLANFPHTYEFTVQTPVSLYAEVSVVDTQKQINDASLIVVKEEKHGVSEIGRTNAKSELWKTYKDAMLAEAFRAGGHINAQLEKGTYRLEVSSPNNDAVYRLVLGTSKIKRGYFDNLRVLFEVRSFLGASPFTIVQSPLIYWPIVTILLLVVIGFVYIERKKRAT